MAGGMVVNKTTDNSSNPDDKTIVRCLLTIVRCMLPNLHFNSNSSMHPPGINWLRSTAVGMPGSFARWVNCQMM